MAHRLRGHLVVTWQDSLVEGRIGLRPIRRRDARVWREVRLRNIDWLQQWEATVPEEGLQAGEVPATFGAMVATLQRQARAGRVIPWVVTYDGRLVGQLTIGGIAYGSLRSAYIGYWVDEAVAGRGIMPTAVAMALDHCFDQLGLHRVEIHIRPENAASRRVVEKLGIAEEGLRRSYLHIDGDWRDHICYAIVAGERPGGILADWRSTQSR
ncbi:MAG: GNAT family protein [Candidatus Nanopelagicales bacterium]|nr:GNAT family protein [Candidatus Nanopelagicales bacterium]